MNRILPLILLAWWFANVSPGAETPADAPPYRYLFLYDCSYSMTKAGPNGCQAIADLIYSGLQGRMQPGERFGVWPFSFQVFTNRIPPMTWQPGAHQALSDGTLAQLKVIRNDKQSKMDVLWREVTKAARASDLFTAIVVSDGDDPFKGTPFDTALNQMVKAHAKELRRAKKPFLAVLSAVKGQFVAYTIGPAGEPIDFQSLNRQLARVFPPEPLAPLVTNIITTNIIIVTNLPVPVTSAPPAPSEDTPVTTVAPLLAAMDEPSSSPPTNAPPAVAVPDPDRQGIFTQPPPLFSESKTKPPVITNSSKATPPPLTNQARATPPSAPSSNSPAPIAAAPAKPTPEPPVSTSSRPPSTPPPPTLLEAKSAVDAKPTPPSAPPAVVRPVVTNPAPASPLSVTQALALSKLAAVPLVPTAKKTPTPPKNSFWHEKGGFVLFAAGSLVAGVVVFLILYRAAQRKPQPSFISQSIDKHLR